MQAPRFFTPVRTLTVVTVGMLLATLAIGKPLPWWVALPLLAGPLLDLLLIWRLEVQLHNQRRLANYYEDALRDLRKELGRG